VAYVPRKNGEVIGYTDGLGRANGEPGRSKATPVAEKSNEGLTMSAWRRLSALTRQMQRVPPGEGEEQDSMPQHSPLSALNESIEIPTLREVLCSPERRREEPEKR